MALPVSTTHLARNLRSCLADVEREIREFPHEADDAANKLLLLINYSQLVQCKARLLVAIADLQVAEMKK